MDNLLHKRSVSFASIIVDSLGNKVVEAKKVGKSNSFRLDVNNPLGLGGEGELVLPLVAREEHCIVNDSADWKIRYGDRVISEEQDEEFHILQRVADFPPVIPKRKREALVTDNKEAQNSLVCKVYLLDRRSLVNRWRRLVVPSSTYCQAVVDIIVNSFNIERSPTFHAKRHFSDKYVFKGGPTKKHVKHAMLVPISELNLEAGDGIDIFYGSSKLSLRVEYVRDAHSLKYNIERGDVQLPEGVAAVNGVHIVGANSADNVLL